MEPNSSGKDPESAEVEPESERDSRGGPQAGTATGWAALGRRGRSPESGMGPRCGARAIADFRAAVAGAVIQVACQVEEVAVVAEAVVVAAAAAVGVDDQR